LGMKTSDCSSYLSGWVTKGSAYHISPPSEKKPPLQARA
jgi:hypothetical protein